MEGQGEDIEGCLRQRGVRAMDLRPKVRQENEEE